VLTVIGNASSNLSVPAPGFHPRIWVAALLLLLAGILCKLAILPVLEVRSTVVDVGEGRTTKKAGAARLGPPKLASQRIRSYLRLPDWIAARKRAALLLLAFYGEAGVAVLTEQLTSDESGMRFGAADVLGRMGNVLRKMGPAALPTKRGLISLLNDATPDVRHAAIEALGRGFPLSANDIPVLTARLRDSDTRLQMYAIYLLGKMGREATPAVPALIECLKMADWDTQNAAIDALIEVGPSAVPLLKKAAADEKVQGRDAILDALKRIEAKASSNGAPIK